MAPAKKDKAARKSNEPKIFRVWVALEKAGYDIEDREKIIAALKDAKVI